MASYNRIVMVGNLTRDPEYRQLPSGQGVCQLGLASNRQYRNKQTGSMVQEVCFVDVDVFGPQAESCHQYLQKGRPVLVEGRLKFDMWDSPEGQKRSKHSIVADRVVFLSSAQADEEGADKAAASSELEKEFLGASQAPKPKAKKAEKKEVVQSDEDFDDAASGSQVSGEVNFKDEPPFPDELPF
ncbi:MAG: single-stranded DNA-binding protein [Candidatus Babeliales bacterium]